MLSVAAAALAVTQAACASAEATANGLTGDLVHFQYMWDNRVVPPFNFDEEQSLASIDRVVRLIAEHQAQLWIGHDRETAVRSDDTRTF